MEAQMLIQVCNSLFTIHLYLLKYGWEGWKVVFGVLASAKQTATSPLYH